MATVLEFLSLLARQQGDRYEFGHEVVLSDEDPDVFDCSELVQWACHRLRLDPVMPDRSWIQWQHCKAKGTLIPVELAYRTPGALLFRFLSTPESASRPKSAHVAVSLGSGLTFEASREIPGVSVFTTEGRVWTHAGLIPGMSYKSGVPSTSITGPSGGQEDSLLPETVEIPLSVLAQGARRSDSAFHRGQDRLVAELDRVATAQEEQLALAKKEGEPPPEVPEEGPETTTGVESGPAGKASMLIIRVLYRALGAVIDRNVIDAGKTNSNLVKQAETDCVRAARGYLEPYGLNVMFDDAFAGGFSDDTFEEQARKRLILIADLTKRIVSEVRDDEAPLRRLVAGCAMQSRSSDR